MAWTYEEIRFLKKHYKKSVAADIAAQLGRSRKSVIGKAWRLGLSDPQSHKNVVKKAIQKMQSVAVIYLDDANRNGTTLADMPPGRCLYGFGRKNGVHVFCGKKCTDGTNYCLQHVDWCYTRR